MEKIKLIALRTTYYGRTIAAGETFEATPSHANLMVKCKAARLADEQPPKRNEYKRRDMRAER